MNKILLCFIFSSIFITGYCKASSSSIGGWVLGGGSSESEVNLTMKGTIFANNASKSYTVQEVLNQFNSIAVNAYSSSNNQISGGTLDMYIGRGERAYSYNGLTGSLFADVSACIIGNGFKICGDIPNNDAFMINLHGEGNNRLKNGTPVDVKFKVTNIRSNMSTYFNVARFNAHVRMGGIGPGVAGGFGVMPKSTAQKEVRLSAATNGATLTASSIVNLKANGPASEFATLTCTEHPAEVTLNTSIAKNRFLIDGTPINDFLITCADSKEHHLAVEPLRSAPIGKTTEMINMTLIYN